MIRRCFSLLLLLGATACSAPSAPPAQSQLDDTLTMPVDSSGVTDALAKAGRPSVTDDAVDTTTFPYPVVAGKKSPGGYPIYLIECNAMSRDCVGPTGQPIGSLEEVAKQLTPIRNSDVLDPHYHCRWVCTDNEGNVVGAVSPDMQTWLQAHRPDALSSH